MQVTPTTNFIAGIDKIGTANKLGQGENFSNILSDAMSNAQEADSLAAQSNVELLTGENDSIHTAMIQSEKAELALNLAIQVRNKVVEAYKEIMSMQV